MSDWPWLSIVGAVPLVGAVLVAFVPERRGALAKQVAMGVALLTLVLAVVMSAGFDTGSASRFQFTQSYSWIPQFGAHYAVGVDGIGLVLIDLTAILIPIVLLASWSEAELGGRSARTYFALILSLEAMLVGVFAATDLFLFYVFFEAMLVPMYFIIGSYGRAGTHRSYAAVKFLLYSLFGGLLMLAAVIGLYVIRGSLLFGDLQGVGNTVAASVDKGLFLGFFLAFAIKAPLWPFHTWLPDAAAEAPTSGAVLLVGVLDKVGTFGFLRWCLPLFPRAVHDLAPYVLALAVISVLYGALLAIGQRDLKRLVAYTSISHFGFIALGIFAFTSQGGTGATLYMVNHGFSTGALFLVVGFLIHRRRTSQIADYNGVQQVAPWLAGAFFVAGLSSLALPGTNSFVSEFLVLVGTFTKYRWFAVAAVFGTVLAALYILNMYQRTMHGPVDEANRLLPDLTSREAWVIGPMLVLVVLLGVYPKPVIDTIDPAVKRTLCDTGRTDTRPSVPARGPGADTGKPFVSCAGISPTSTASGGGK
jgi:NADH-quinone oxidoreductase subunit M